MAPSSRNTSASEMFSTSRVRFQLSTPPCHKPERGLMPLPIMIYTHIVSISAIVRLVVSFNKLFLARTHPSFDIVYTTTGLWPDSRVTPTTETEELHDPTRNRPKSHCSPSYRNTPPPLGIRKGDIATTDEVSNVTLMEDKLQEERNVFHKKAFGWSLFVGINLRLNILKFHTTKSGVLSSHLCRLASIVNTG